MKLFDPIPAYWMIARRSLSEQMNWVEFKLEKMESLARNGKTYPMLETLESTIHHQELLLESGDNLNNYILKIPPRESGFRNGYACIDTDSPFFLKIRSLAKNSLPKMLSTLRLLETVRRDNLEKIFLKKKSSPTFPYWGTVLYQGEEVLEFRRTVLDNKHAIIFITSNEDREMPWKSITYDLEFSSGLDKQEAIGIAASTKLIPALTKEGFFD